MEEYRREYRSNRYEDVVLDILVEAADGNVVQNAIRCKTVDVSYSGLRVFMDHSTPVGTIMTMCIHCSSSGETYRLTTELRWIREAADPGWYFAGFEIFDNELSDYQGWRRFVHSFIPEEERLGR